MPSDGDHRHCKVCGRVTKPESETCSKECAAERERRVSSARNYRYLLYALIAFVLVLFLASYRL